MTEINIFENVETLLFFIGYPRSGHSLIGSLLDAHPEIVIAHELNAYPLFEKGFSAEEVFSEIVQNAIEFTRQGRNWMGYNYLVPNQWQGKFTKIKIIGDKAGGMTTRHFKQKTLNDPIKYLKDITGKQIKMIHVIRNPFDNISTMVARTHKRNQKPIDKTLLLLKCKHYFELVTVNQKLRSRFKQDIIDIHLEKFIRQPEAMLQKLFDFLKMETNIQYLMDCKCIVWEKEHQTRSELQHLWNEDMIAMVLAKNSRYDFLENYSFTN